MTYINDNFVFDDESLCLEACKISWDSDILGVPVAAISRLDLRNMIGGKIGFDVFNSWVRDNNYGMISCRLPHHKLLESALLERNNFRFIEMVLHPELTDLNKFSIDSHGLKISNVEFDELPLVSNIAARSFKYERFHVDPFIDPVFGDARYRAWVENSYNNENQNLLKATLNGNILGFFMVEYIKNSVYWHLTAISPEWQGKGNGSRVWMAMIEFHKNNYIEKVFTTISARNVPVHNLYSKLNFRFQSPEMTFHWVDDTIGQL